MEAELVSELPEQGGWRYEPKWDGFRGVLENDGGELALWSRNGRPLLRYFPELRPLGELLAGRPELGEVAEQRALVPAPERELAAVVLEHSAEAVPFGLVLPALALGHLLDEESLHGWEGHVRTGHWCRRLTA